MERERDEEASGRGQGEGGGGGEAGLERDQRKSEKNSNDLLIPK